MRFTPTLQTIGFSFLGALLLSACSTTVPSNMMDIQPQETLVLQESVEIPAGNAKTYIQFGKISGQSFDQREPHCRLEINELQAQDTHIQPQAFKIERVQIGEEQIARKVLPAGLQFAFVGNALAVGDQQPPETFDYVHLYLTSNKQPNVLRLTCAGALSNGDPFDDPRSYRPQRAQVNLILGKVGFLVY